MFRYEGMWRSLRSVRGVDFLSFTFRVLNDYSAVRGEVTQGSLARAQPRRL